MTLRVDDDDGGFVLRSVFVAPGTAQGAVAALATKAPVGPAALSALAHQAIADWTALGATGALLENAELVFTDLGGDLLGLSYRHADGKATIYIDDDAGGRGWLWTPLGPWMKSLLPATAR